MKLGREWGVGLGSRGVLAEGVAAQVEGGLEATRALRTGHGLRAVDEAHVLAQVRQVGVAAPTLGAAHALPPSPRCSTHTQHTYVQSQCSPELHTINPDYLKIYTPQLKCSFTQHCLAIYTADQQQHFVTTILYFSIDIIDQNKHSAKALHYKIKLFI